MLETYAWRLENTGWTRITATWPKDDLELLEKSWRKSSLKTYDAPWKTWVTRYRQLHLDPNDPDPATVALHLSYLHRVKQFSPGTNKLHKSVISVLANPLKREEISSQPLVSCIQKFFFEVG
ncbi:hypothetical protein HF086_013064 [Spodoptera exigua]|uniref:Uncharacterized protein n=1 Tax=Spodoptera exigua TaxID=7107 RepID=A0A922M0Q0_SPOEX|nr:hypothetical protein HF086_013064 [Spodoptera exigua]